MSRGAAAGLVKPCYLGASMGISLGLVIVSVMCIMSAFPPERPAKRVFMAFLWI
jgi:hypothetical protein